MDLKFLNKHSELKKYKYHYIFIIIILLTIIYFLVQIINININSGDTIINSVYASLILGLISLIGVLTNDSNNKKILNQNEESRFIQLRFKDSKEAVNELVDFIQKTCIIYKELKDLNKNKKNESKLLSPRDFLVMQFVILITNKELLNKLPSYVKSKIESEFNGKWDYKWDEEANETLNKIDYHLNTIGDSLFNSIPIYDDFISKFKTMPNYEYNKTIFKSYAYSNISEDEFLSHFINILNEISNTKLEDLILKDKDVELTELHNDDFFEEFLIN